MTDNCPSIANSDQTDTNKDGSGDACDCFPVSHCLNDAECAADFQSFSCFCTLDFTGRLCDIAIDECEASSCANGSTCVDLIGMTRCECPPGYWGIRCSLISDYNSTVVESVNGFFVAQVTPTDVDEVSTPVLHHEIISGNEQELFFIDPIFGDITTSANVDREKADIHVLAVEVTEPRDDPPLVARRTTAQVIIHVADINDNAPVFVQTEWHANVAQSSDANTAVTTVRASDRDIGSNAQLLYSIASQPATNFFWIDPLKGTVALNRFIPWNNMFRNITIWINVTDRGQPPLASKTLAAVHVCPPGFIGAGCNVGEMYWSVRSVDSVGIVSLLTERDECVPNPCSRYALYCQDKFADYVCVCRTGYTSKRCEAGKFYSIQSRFMRTFQRVIFCHSEIALSV